MSAAPQRAKNHNDTDIKLIDEASPQDRAIILCARNVAGDGDFAVGIWYFGDWAMTAPELGDRLLFKPTH